MLNDDCRPAVIDLFSGVGGLSLGAARAGFRIAASAELDPIASRSHADNFPATVHIEQDVATLTGESLLRAADLSKSNLAGLIGGPPCQGFSLIGKRDETDPRNDLFGHFFRLVRESNPLFYIAENVPGILSEKTRNFVQEAIGVLPTKYKSLSPVRVEAHRYGAPTTRTRVFFIGYDSERLGPLVEEDFLPRISIEQVTVGDALEGLPSVRSKWQHESQSWRRVAPLPDNFYGNSMQGRIPPEVGNLNAISKLREKNLVSGFLGTLHAPDTVTRFSKLKPGQIDDVYRSPRLRRDGFCPTLRAGTNKDKGSYQAVRPIHPTSPRVITPREAARMQGFPDWFIFNPTKWHSFRQIGNSVSPIVAEEILSKIHEHTIGRHTNERNFDGN